LSLLIIEYQAKAYKGLCLVVCMDSSDIENQASEIAYAVEDLKYQVQAMRDALKAVRDAAEEGIDELDCL